MVIFFPKDRIKCLGFHSVLLAFYSELGSGCCQIKNSVIETVSVKDLSVITQDLRDYHMLTSFRDL